MLTKQKWNAYEMEAFWKTKRKFFVRNCSYGIVIFDGSGERYQLIGTQNQKMQEDSDLQRFADSGLCRSNILN